MLLFQSHNERIYEGATVLGSFLPYLKTVGQPRKSAFGLIIKNFTFMNFGNPQAYGGALSLAGIDSLILEHVSFINCTGLFGGAVFISGNGTSDAVNEPKAVVKDCTFSSNKANFGGGLCMLY